jgi:hypothetical protein
VFRGVNQKGSFDYLYYDYDYLWRTTLKITVSHQSTN